MTQAVKKKSSHSGKTSLVSVDYDALLRIAQKIIPVSAFCEFLRMSPDYFLDNILTDNYRFIRETILAGECKRYIKEQDDYNLYFQKFTTAEELVKRDQAGQATRFQITPQIMQAKAWHWANFQKIYERRSFDHWFRARVEKISEKSGTDDSYLTLLRELTAHADKISGVKGRKPGDLTARPEQLRIPILQQKRAVLAEKQPSAPARRTSSVLWLPDNPAKNPKKIILRP